MYMYLHTCTYMYVDTRIYMYVDTCMYVCRNVLRSNLLYVQLLGGEATEREWTLNVLYSYNYVYMYMYMYVCDLLCTCMFVICYGKVDGCYKIL